MVPACFQDAQLLFHAGFVIGVMFITCMHGMEQLKITNERLIGGAKSIFTHVLLPDLSKVPTGQFHRNVNLSAKISKWH